MFTCPLHQWASHELPCPACKNQSGITSSNSVLINPDGYVEPSPAAPPPDHRTAKAIQQPNGSYKFEYTEWKDEGQEGLPGILEAGVIAANMVTTIKPELSAHEASFFIAGFQECIKYLTKKK